jgi:flagellar biosynthesis protein FlhA
MFVRMSPPAIEATCNSIAAELPKLTTANHTPIILVSPQIRAALKQITENQIPQLVVLSFNEVTRDTQIATVGLASD